MCRCTHSVVLSFHVTLQLLGSSPIHPRQNIILCVLKLTMAICRKHIMVHNGIQQRRCVCVVKWCFITVVVPSYAHSFIHSYSFNVQVDITQLQTDRDARKEDRIITRHSLVERRARYLFYCMFVCLFVCSVNDFSATRRPIHAIFCMRA